ncbi:MAG: hypothetical protein AB7O32_05530 [Vicinamibacterales bacterium]
MDTTTGGRCIGARRTALVCCLVLCSWIGSVVPVSAQLGSLLSPGRLNKAHANLEGLSNCAQCHEQGRKVTASKCLACHKPIADRIASKRGVHKDVTDECVACHAEHAGTNGELRPFEPGTFDHARVTGFALDGGHANLAGGCAACHKQRTFLDQKSTCVSCHADVHKPSLGAACQSCHTTRAFTGSAAGFDHTKAAFQLTGAHRTVGCEKCHVNRQFKGIAFNSCASCHKDPHRQAFGTACSTCHGNDASWRTTRIDHGRTAFALIGAHQKATCASCHKQPAMRVKPRSDRCAACHVDVHRGTFQQDCKSCHNETSFAKAPFDHSTTRFALTGKHAPLVCEACHANAAAGRPAAVSPGAARTQAARASTARPATSGGGAATRVADFRGLEAACVSCHADVHQAQLGAACESCHTADSFKVQTFTHASAPSFFGGQHAALACAQCHVPAGVPQPVRTGRPVVLNVQYRNLATTCATCHKDVHLGQTGAACETCHTLDEAKFAVPRFEHAKTAFRLTGTHETTACAQCHKVETGAFPSGHGTAVRYRGLGRECRACHQDVHLGQVAATCETCHDTRRFTIERYLHRNASALTGFFRGAHARADCQACHKSETRQFPAGRGTATRFAVDAGCVSCHTDVHKGALGPDCASCHRL